MIANPATTESLRSIRDNIDESFNKRWRPRPPLYGHFTYHMTSQGCDRHHDLDDMEWTEVS
jgi:hypothetical protein